MRRIHPQSSTEILRIKAAVRRRDAFRCAKCGMTNQEHRRRHGRSLHVHRLQPGSLYSEEGCTTRCFRCHGSEPRREPGEPEQVYVTTPVRVPSDLLRAARRHCAHTPGRAGKSLKLVDYLAAILRPIITGDYNATMDRVAAERQQAKSRKGKAPDT